MESTQPKTLVVIDPTKENFKRAADRAKTLKPHVRVLDREQMVCAVRSSNLSHPDRVYTTRLFSAPEYGVHLVGECFDDDGQDCPGSQRSVCYHLAASALRLEKNNRRRANRKAVTA